MNKLILSVLAIATVGLVAWALMPSADPVRAPAPDRPAPADPRDPAPAAEPAAAPAAAGRRPAPPAVAAPAPVDRPPPLELLPPLIGLPEGEVKPMGEGAHGRRPDDPMPQLAFADVKETVRRYYANLPRTGRMPARITVAELFPPALYEGMRVPPTSQVVEIGHHPATGTEGLVEILEMVEAGQSTLGITVVTQDGQRVRDYVQLVAPPE